MEITKDDEAPPLFLEVQTWLQSRGMTQRDLARMLDLTAPTLSRYLTGQRPLPVGCAIDIATITGIPVTRLIADPDVQRLAKFLCKHPKAPRHNRRRKASVA